MIPRIYKAILNEHFDQNQQMLFLSGPRQCGKTTVSLMAEELTDQLTYLNWDNSDHRAYILKGPAFLAEFLKLNKLSKVQPIVIFDELHKYTHWKRFLKGFYDTYKGRIKMIVTGSSRLDIYKKGGDSLMGRYFPYRVHPLTVAEIHRTNLIPEETGIPVDIGIENFENLWTYGGFPEPFIKKSQKFSNRWKDLRQKQLIKEDLRDLSRIQELGQVEILSEIIRLQAGQLMNTNKIASQIQASADSIHRWVQTLNAFFYCFTLRPWSRNVRRSLTKEPKVYLWDWSVIAEEGARFENFIASHLLKAVHFWKDRGLGQYELFFLRDKEKREVDFLVTKNQRPWFMVEAKFSGNASINKNLYYFQNEIKAEHAFQVVFDMNFINKDCFKLREPTIVPAQTFLSQLV